jgi:nucleoside 2-deoxyribosyltransferase
VVRGCTFSQTRVSPRFPRSSERLSTLSAWATCSTRPTSRIAGEAWSRPLGVQHIASSAYAQTTDVVIFQDYARRDSKLSLSQLRDLGGTVLPWEVRQAYDIYLAAPDFKGRENGAIERAVSALRYHNFNVRRPVQENGQLSPGSDLIELRSVYEKDVALLRSCRLVFAIPIGRDPGTLVEVGLGIAAGIPVVVFDPDKECPNTMVMAGGNCYSQDLDACINEVFTILSNIRSAS